MVTLEFYVRNESETEARGPFNLEQLSSLLENGQVTVETLYYDATTEAWTPIGANEELKTALFPEKKKLQIKAQVAQPTMDRAASDSRPPITVNEMLAAAEGRTFDTKEKVDPQIAMGRAAAIGTWSAVIILLLAAAAEAAPSIDFITNFQIGDILNHPLVILGALDLILAILLALGMTTLYPFVRFRAALGLGFVGFIFFSQGLSMPLLAVMAGTVGLYFCTITVSIPIVTVSALAGILGMAGVAYRMIIAN